MKQLPDITLKIRATKEENIGERVLDGIAVPYGETVAIWDEFERFEPGSIELMEGAKLFYRHGEPIGLIMSGEDTPGGYRVSAKISQTPLGDEVYTLLRDGVLDRFSIGFEPIESREEKDENGQLVTVHMRALVKEVSVVPFPAYDGAKIEQIRQKPTTTKEKEKTKMENNSHDLTEVRENIEDIARRVTVLEDSPAGAREEASPLAQYRSYGEYVKAVVTDMPGARAAYQGATTSNMLNHPQWAGMLLDELKAVTPLTNAFASAPLPSSGMTIEYGVEKTNTIKVEKQANEADILAFGKLEFDRKSQPIITLGGYTSVTRQVIERCIDPQYLDRAFSAMAKQYALALEKLVSTEITNSLKTAANVGAAPAFGTDATSVIDTMLELAAHFADNNQELSGIFVNKETFKQLAAVAKKETLLTFTGTQFGGSIDIKGFSGNLLGVDIKLLPGADAPKAFAYNKNAVISRVSAGAPFKLADEDITNLTNLFSVYGYASVYTQDPRGLVSIGVKG